MSALRIGIACVRRLPRVKRPSVFTQRGVDREAFHHLLRSSRVVTLLADGAREHAAVPLGRVLMQAVATQARGIRSVQRHVANIHPDVPVAGVQGRVVRPAPVNFVILEQVIAGDEIVRIRQAGGLRLSAAEVALRARGFDRKRIAAALLR